MAIVVSQHTMIVHLLGLWEEERQQREEGHSHAQPEQAGDTNGKSVKRGRKGGSERERGGRSIGKNKFLVYST